MMDPPGTGAGGEAKAGWRKEEKKTQSVTLERDTGKKFKSTSETCKRRPAELLFERGRNFLQTRRGAVGELAASHGKHPAA